MRRALLTLAFVALLMLDLAFVPFAGVLVMVGGIDALIGANGHGSGSRSAFLLGAALFVCGGILLAGLLLWLTRRVLRALRAG